MSSAAQIPEMDGFQDEPLQPRSSRSIYVGFATMVTVGLALAGWYVGERILVAQAPHSIPEPVTVAPTPAVPSSSTTSTPVMSAPQPAILPHVIEYYLQVAALGPAHDGKFIRQLHNKGFQAHLETAPPDETGAILVGPYSDETALQHARARLAASGILATQTIR